MHQALVLVLPCFIFALFGCDAQRVVPTTELMPGIRSHISTEEARKQIRSAERWRVLEDTKTPNDDKRPPYHLLGVAIDKYVDLEEPGTLHLQFFNDRLMSATFYPQNAERYLASLKEKRGLDVSGAQTASAGGTSIQHAIDFRGQPYISYVDKVLQKELDLWIRRYSQLRYEPIAA